MGNRRSSSQAKHGTTGSTTIALKQKARGLHHAICSRSSSSNQTRSPSIHRRRIFICQDHSSSIYLPPSRSGFAVAQPPQQDLPTPSSASPLPSVRIRAPSVWPAETGKLKSTWKRGIVVQNDRRFGNLPEMCSVFCTLLSFLARMSKQPMLILAAWSRNTLCKTSARYSVKSRVRIIWGGGIDTKDMIQAERTGDPKFHFGT